jgi:hypothetical protein
MFIPDPGSGIFPILDPDPESIFRISNPNPGVKKAPDPGSGTLTVTQYTCGEQ